MNFKINLALLAAVSVAMATKAALTAPKTNNVMALSFTLAAIPNAVAMPPPVVMPALVNTDIGTQSTNRPFRISSKDIIGALNGVTNNGTAMHFSTGARLLLKQIVSPLAVVANGLGTNEQIIVRQEVAGHTVDTDVSDFFSNSVSYFAPVFGTQPVTHEELSTYTMAIPGKLSFTLSALAVKKTGPTQTNGVSVLQSENWNVQGFGTNSTAQVSSQAGLILTGSISAGPGHLE
jgi:hypothetical protein